MNVDDPKLTAYALNELDEPERAAIARVIGDSPEAQHCVADTQTLAHALRSEYALEFEKHSIAREKFVSVHDDSFWSKTGPLAIAAVLALLALIGAVASFRDKLGTRANLPGSSSSREISDAGAIPNESAPVEGEEAAQAGENPSREADAGPYAYTGERPFVSVRSRPRSSLPLLVNSSSYAGVRRSINAGVLPARDAVNVEGMINYFAYDYPQPIGDESFSFNIDVVSCPWDGTHRLVRIGLKSREPVTVAEDSGVEVEFNPRYVASYRLIGYDRQSSAGQNLNNGKIGSDRIPAGYTLTAFYEAIPVSEKPGTAGTMIASGVAHTVEHVLSAKLQLRTPGNAAIRSIERVVTDTGSTFAGAPQELKFAAAVAEFGMILRDSEYKGTGTLQQVLEWAQEGKGADADGSRADFIELVRKAQTLLKG